MLVLARGGALLCRRALSSSVRAPVSSTLSSLLAKFEELSNSRQGSQEEQHGRQSLGALFKELAADPDASPHDLLQGAKLALVMNDCANSLSLAHQAQQRSDPSRPVLGASLVEGMARVDQGLLSKAEAAFREEMSLLEGVAAPGRDMEWVRQRAEVVLQMARLLSLSHEYMESAGGQCPLEPPRKASALLQEAEELLHTLQGTEAEQRQNRQRSDVLVSHLSVLFKSQQFERVLEVLDELSVEDPEVERLVSYRGDALANLGRHREAAKAHLAFVESADDDMSIRTLAVVRQKAGACYAMAGDLGRAEEQWAVVSQMGLDHSECLSPSEQGTVMAQRATAQLQLERKERALELVDEGLQRAGRHFFPLLDLRATVLRSLGRNQEAEEAEAQSREEQGLSD